MAQQQQIAVQMNTNDHLALSIMRKLDKVPYQSTTTKRYITIFRVPSHIKERNKNIYEPRMVSIGPYHRGRDDLKFVEKEKLRCVGKMLSENPDVTLNDYLEMLIKLEPAARKCYYENIEMNSNEFVEMLLYDACFIINLVVNWSSPDSDIISRNIHCIKSDLLMLENQIPFFVLRYVFDLYSSRDDDCITKCTEFDKASNDGIGGPEKASLFDVLVEFLKNGNETFRVPEGDEPCEHLLNFYYHCYMSTQKLPMAYPQRKKFLIPCIIIWPKKVFVLIFSIKELIMHKRLPMIEKRKPRMIPCATELQEAGITFKKAETKSIFDIHFSHGVLRIPYTLVEEATRPQIMNLIAFEQCNGEEHKPFTSYTLFMDCIVNTPRDLLILQQNGIIENKLANEMAAAEFFNQLRYCSYPDYDKHHLADLFKNIKNYCDNPWHRNIAKFHQYYLSNPWSIILFIAAIVLLLFNFLANCVSCQAIRPSIALAIR